MTRPSTADILAKIRQQKELGLSQPITPEQVVSKKAELIPGGVIEAFNELITKNFNGSSSTVKQSDAVALIMQKMDCARDKVFSEHWLDVEILFRDAGWRVEYDKPGFNESYDATFKFSRAK